MRYVQGLGPLPTNFIHYGYMAIYNTCQFFSACKKWNLKPATQRTTEQQMRDHFGKHYNIFQKERNSMNTFGIANNALLQAEIQQQ